MSSNSTTTTGTLPLRVVSRTREGAEVWEGVVSIRGMAPTKVARPDNTTQFATRGAVVSSARNLARRLGYTDVEVNQPQTAVRKAAKRRSTTECKVTS